MMRSGFGLSAGVLSLFLFSPASQAVDQTFIIPAGSNLHVQLTVTASTKTNQSGDPWTGKVVEPIIAQGQEVVPAGSMAEGRITFVKPPGRAKGVGEMRLVLDKITTSEGLQYAVAAGLEDIQGAGDAKVKGEEGTIKGPGKSKKGTAVETGVGAGVGAAAGGIAAGGSGAEYGAIIGAAGGLLHSMLKHHKDIVIPQGTELTFVISRNIPGKKAPDSADASNPR
jgi:type IV secretion system protein VirB10